MDREQRTHTKFSASSEMLVRGREVARATGGGLMCLGGMRSTQRRSSRRPLLRVMKRRKLQQVRSASRKCVRERASGRAQEGGRGGRGEGKERSQRVTRSEAASARGDGSESVRVQVSTRDRRECTCRRVVARVQAGVKVGSSR